MKLYSICKSCKRHIPIKSHASTRPDLEMERGEQFRITCNHCAIEQEKHVNDVRAKQNNTIVIGGIVLGGIATLLLLTVLGAVAVATFIIPILIYQQQQSSVKTFNTYRSRRFH